MRHNVFLKKKKNRLQLFCKLSQGQVREYGLLPLLSVCALYLVGTLLSPPGDTALLHLPQSARKYSSPPVPQPPMPQVGVSFNLHGDNTLGDSPKLKLPVSS